MRVALSLHGGVGNLYTNKRSFVEGRPRLPHRPGNYRRHLFDVNDSVDVFIHSSICSI
jgi:hypothetical protein